MAAVLLLTALTSGHFVDRDKIIVAFILLCVLPLLTVFVVRPPRRLACLTEPRVGDWLIFVDYVMSLIFYYGMIIRRCCARFKQSAGESHHRSERGGLLVRTLALAFSFVPPDYNPFRNLTGRSGRARSGPLAAAGSLSSR